MGDMGVGHQKIVVADARLPRRGRAPMDRDVFAEDVAVADFQTSRLAVVFEVLRRFAENDAAVRRVIAAQCQRAEQLCARPNDASRTNADLAFNNDVWPDLGVVGDVGLDGYQRRGMNASGLCDRHNGTRLEQAKRKVPATDANGCDRKRTMVMPGCDTESKPSLHERTTV